MLIPKTPLPPLRRLTVMGLMVALSGVLSLFTLYPTQTFRVLHFAYLPGAVGSILFGFPAGVMLGIGSDIVSWLIKPGGAFFWGFTLSAVVQNLIYAAFLYRRPLRVFRVALAQFAVTVVVSLGLNMIWLQMMYGMSAGTFFVWERLLMHLLFFPLHTALLFLLTRLTHRMLWGESSQLPAS